MLSLATLYDMRTVTCLPRRYLLHLVFYVLSENAAEELWFFLVFCSVLKCKVVGHHLFGLLSGTIPQVTMCYRGPPSPPFHYMIHSNHCKGENVFFKNINAPSTKRHIPGNFFQESGSVTIVVAAIGITNHRSSSYLTIKCNF